MTTKTLNGTEQQLQGTDDAGVTYAAFDAAPLPAAGAIRKSEVVAFGDADDKREGSLILRMRYVGGTSASAGRPQIKIFTSDVISQPSLTDASWTDEGTTDGVVTPSVTFGGAGSHNQVELAADVMTTKETVEAAGVISRKIRLSIDARWVRFEACEYGETGHPGTLTIAVGRA